MYDLSKKQVGWENFWQFYSFLIFYRATHIKYIICRFVDTENIQNVFKKICKAIAGVQNLLKLKVHLFCWGRWAVSLSGCDYRELIFLVGTWDLISFNQQSVPCFLIFFHSTDHGSCLVLDFTPPAADYLDLRNRLKAQQVCLETCFVQEHLLSGTIQVRNMCFEKSVSVRITFDSWNSFQDMECQYLNNIYGCSDTDTFSFSISMPEFLKPSNRVEFCIQYQTQQQTFWDNNHGNNYQLRVADPNCSLIQSSETPALLEIQRDCIDKREEMEFDPFGSPRTSAGIFPEWQSWGRVEISTPYWWAHH